MADQDTAPAATPSALRQYQALLAAYTAAGYATLPAYEAIERDVPGLTQAANAEVRRKTLRGELPSAPYNARR
jgi:hypothetical protein